MLVEFLPQSHCRKVTKFTDICLRLIWILQFGQAASARHTRKWIRKFLKLFSVAPYVPIGCQCNWIAQWGQNLYKVEFALKYYFFDCSSSSDIVGRPQNLKKISYHFFKLLSNIKTNGRFFKKKLWLSQNILCNVN